MHSICISYASGTHKFILSIESNVLKLNAAQELKARSSCEQRPGITSWVFLQWSVYMGGYCYAQLSTFINYQHTLLLIQAAKMPQFTHDPACFLFYTQWNVVQLLSVPIHL